MLTELRKTRFKGFSIRVLWATKNVLIAEFFVAHLALIPVIYPSMKRLEAAFL